MAENSTKAFGRYLRAIRERSGAGSATLYVPAPFGEVSRAFLVHDGELPPPSELADPASSADFVATSAVSRADTVSREYRARAADRCEAREEALPRASADSDRVDAIDARSDDSTRWISVATSENPARIAF